MSAFFESLRRAAQAHRSRVCVGLDPEPERIPDLVRDVRSIERTIVEFNRAIVDATGELVCAYKPQIAHYAAYGAEDALHETIRYIRERAPSVPVILDAKRGDIGSTAERYADEAFTRYGADAVTVNPYLGSDALAPFLAHADKGVFVLCRTSNPSARELQDLQVGDRKLYQVIAERAASEWNAKGNCALVVGATWPEELADIRARTGDMTFLVPGIGAQGGDVARAVIAGRTADREGLVVNSSRAILYASRGDDFAAAAHAATRSLRDAIESARAS